MDDFVVSSWETIVINAIKSGQGVRSIKSDYGALVSESVLDNAISNVRARLDTVYDLVDPYVIAAEKVREVGYRWYQGPTERSVRWHFAHERLVNEGRSKEEIDDVLKASTRILGLLSSPAIDRFASRGLVLGYVQSGKTTNFIATISQAADEGYRLIIVLSGVTNNLRRQTQARLENSLTGTNPNNWNWLTSEDKDFNESMNANDLLSAPDKRVIMVIKKNNTRLRKLRTWLASAPMVVRQGLPVLVIDDEADQATINSHKTRDRQTAINKTLTSILNETFLPKHAYLGYTATPFANILSDAITPEQLFPRDFIFPMTRSEKYFGAEQLFGREPISEEDQSVPQGRNIILAISQNDRGILGPLVNSSSSATTATLPQSFLDAFAWFIVATAARRIRTKEIRFSTMLVHTSGKIAAHRGMYELVESLLAQWKAMTKDEVCNILKNCWKEFSKMGRTQGDLPHQEWTEIQDESLSVLNSMKVIVDNSKSEDRLVYDFANEEKSQPILVIGGNTLARGLTLEGLISSYFMRSSNAYDSLLQMGRWFGYRVGYEDLQRIWMQEDLIPHFRDMALVEEEIRQQISELAQEGLQPSQVPIKIRDHKILAITAQNKMLYAKRIQVGYSEKRVETITFNTEQTWLKHNQDATSRLIESVQLADIDTTKRTSEGWTIFRDVPWPLLKAYFHDYKWSESARIANGALISNYIDLHQGTGKLEKWNVFFYQLQNNPTEPLDFGHGISISPINRSALYVDEVKGTVNIHHLVSSIDGAADVPLTKREISAATSDSKVSDTYIRQLRSSYPEQAGERGLLGIYLVNRLSKAEPGTVRKDLHLDAHPVGLGVFFGESHVAAANVDYFGPDLADAFEIEEDDYLDAADEFDDSGEAA